MAGATLIIPIDQAANVGKGGAKKSKKTTRTPNNAEKKKENKKKAHWLSV